MHTISMLESVEEEGDGNALLESDVTRPEQPKSLISSVTGYLRTGIFHLNVFIAMCMRYLHKAMEYGILSRAIQLACILTLTIAILIKVKYMDKPPQSMPWMAKFDFKLNVSSLPHAELWDQEFGEYNVFAELHAHTTRSDGGMQPNQLVDWAIAYGFNVIAVVDHNNVQGGLEARDYAMKQDKDILVIPGMEYSCCRIHMSLIGINETIFPTDAFPSDEEIISVINKTHELGGVIVVNHLPWSLDTGMCLCIYIYIYIYIFILFFF